VGRLDAWKRTDLLVGALAFAPAAKLVVVGRGPEEPRLRRIAQERGVAERIRWLAGASEEELIDLYAGARLVALAPEGEDLGYVPLEAFLSGKAVLTTDDAGGPLEFVRHGETGFVVPPSAEALGRALARAWDEVDALVELGRRGREQAARLSWGATVDALLKAAGLS
jgi:glycosyltransferase involved in cell wall biosynthesis